MSLNWSDYENFHGWCVEEKARYLYEHIIKTKPDIVLEIGLFGGKSFLPMVEAVKENEKGLCVGLEPWDSGPALEGENGKDADDWWTTFTPRIWDDIMNRFLGIIKDKEFDNYVEIHRTTSKDFLDEFTESRRPIDLLHIDGNHFTEQAMYDVVNYVPFLNDGGYLVLDDMDWVSLGPVIQYVELELKFEWVDSITRNEHGTTSCGIYRKI